MKTKQQKKYYAVTPCGTMLVSTEATKKQECITKLLKQTVHIPYSNWKEMKLCGYEIEFI